MILSLVLDEVFRETANSDRGYMVSNDVCACEGGALSGASVPGYNAGAMAATDRNTLLKWTSRVVHMPHSAPSPAQVLWTLGWREGTAVLESLCQRDVYGRYSIVSCDPAGILRCTAPGSQGPFEVLQRVLGECALEPGDSDVPFVGGLIGYLAYEAGRLVEELPCRAERDLGLPDAWFALCDTVAVFDHHRRCWHVAGVELPDAVAPGRPPLEVRVDHLAGQVRRAGSAALPHVADRGPVSRPPVLDRAAYAAGVSRILEYIREGEIYQANLTARLEVAVAGGDVELYLALRDNNPADYMALLHCGDHSVLCSSPELFLQVRGGEVLTRPIKGTRPRSDDPAIDEAYKAELLRSEKDLAELAMIVDLERNDLGRVCEEVTVTWPPELESYRTVHHLVAGVRGRIGELRGGGGWAPQARSLVDVLRATFPGGSITGAPKIRAMQILDELEPVARGPYCGCIGFFGLDGAMTLNIAIRTIVLKNGTAHVHVGSGIVADSDPAAEYDELMAKAKGMFAALGVGEPPASA